MRRLVLLLIVLLNLAQISPTAAQEDPHSLTVANWQFDVTAAVEAPFFMNTIHLGTLDDGREWLVVKMAATNTSGEKIKLHSDDIQLRSNGEMIKQTGDESEGVAEELGAMSIGGSFPHEIEAGKVFEIVQVYKVDPDASDNTLIFDFSGQWDVPLDDLIAASAGDASSLGDGGGSDAVSSPWSIETASYRVDLIGAAVAPTFSGPFHLGSPGAGFNWLVLSYELSSLQDKDTEVKADSHRLLVGTDELKQSTEETKSVSSELGLSMLTLDLKPDESVDVVQVFKVPASALAYTFQLSSRGKLFIDLTPVVALSNGDGTALLPESGVDLASIDTSGSEINAAPPEVSTSTSVPTDVPQATEDSASEEATNPTEPSVATEGPEATESGDTSNLVDPSTALAGRLGGSLTDVKTRFGEPSWTDTGLIGYNSISIGGIDAILVVYYDADETVNKISVVYLERPAVFDDAAAIPSVVAEVMPSDGVCEPVADSSTIPCSSDAVASVFDDSYVQLHTLVGSAGDYHYSIDPTDDEYFELIIQPGASPATTSEQAPTAVPTSETAVTGSASGYSADELAYASEIMRQTQTMADSLNRFAALTEDADISSFVSQDWILAVAVELAIWQQTYQDALALVPPPRFEAAHAKYLEGLSYISQSADAFAYGVDNFDLESIQQATNLMDLGNQAILEAVDEINAVTGA